MISRDQIANDLGQLKNWASWPDSEIEKAISDEAIEILQRAVYVLTDEADTIIVDHGNFVKLVREMDERLSAGSRSLGKAIIEASELAENKEIDKAREVYLRFLASCGSRFYSNIAKAHLRDLE